MLVNDNFDIRTMGADELIYVVGIGKGVLTKTEVGGFLYDVNNHLFKDFLECVWYFQKKFDDKVDIHMVAFNNKGRPVLLCNKRRLARVKYIQVFGYTK